MAGKKGINYKKMRIDAGQWYAKNPDLTLVDLERMTGITQATLVTWKKEDSWDDEREFMQSTPIAIEKLLLKELKSLAEGNAPTIKADAVSKVKSALNLIQKDINPEIVFSIMMILDKFIVDYYPKDIEKSVEIHQEFINHIIKYYG